MTSDIEKYYEIDNEIKSLTKQKDLLRKYIVAEANDHTKSDVYSRETKHIEFPKKLVISREDLIWDISANFPTWDLVDFVEEDESFSVFLRKKVEFTSNSFEKDGFIVERKVVTNSPEINWDSLAKEDPDLINKISQEITTRVVDEDKFKKALNDDPSLMSKLERHIKEGTTSNRLSVKPVKK